jgi:predicted O-methyltransferase YrrM
MNNVILEMKKMKRAMQPYVLFIYEMVLESKAENVLAIGARQCQAERSILSALHENNFGKLISIDLHDRTDRVSSTFPELLPYWKLIIGDSHKQETFNQIKDEKFDILLIDGDHSFLGIKQDYEMYEPLVKDGGYILFHDTHNPNETCVKYFQEIEAKSKLELNYGFAGLGIIQKV